MNKKIDILLGTYNGGKYLENQILSILAQTHKNWSLIIHDDGSTDETSVIIKKYQTIDSRIVLISDDIRFKSAAMNFIHLLKFVESEYIAFCDQDDIWFESKLEILLGRMKEKDYPLAVYCNSYGYNGKNITTDQVTLYHRTSLRDSLFLNGGVQGCCLLFNRRLFEMIIDLPNYICMHDHYLTIASIVFGKLEYVDLSLMLYRQHSNNVTGNIPTSYLQRVKTFFNFSNPVIDKNHYLANVSFYERFRNELTQEQKELFNAYIAFPEKSLFNKILVIIKFKFKIGNSMLPLLLKVLIRKAI
ncbi:glycosyltransferase family 2 protein [Pedobacter sp. MC2016-05]|uniref:glycosyltransferase family 2 protein n=1 Tax=Pedobacter sp. MC2016-05 TaxID=2994474 RepID=UPI0022451496|nr:glycosyltransferase family 2 protein [Pedobacter sp. MC2016-05]MCX2473187.1 glycosyltransferase family 2 protein [Pedobacter sp. MC2016-05]